MKFKLCDLKLSTSSAHAQLSQIFTISLQIPLPHASCKITSLQTALAPLFPSSIFLPFLSFLGPCHWPRPWVQPEHWHKLAFFWPVGSSWGSMFVAPWFWEEKARATQVSSGGRKGT